MLVNRMPVFAAFEEVYVRFFRTTCLFFLLDSDGRFGFDVPESPIPCPTEVPEDVEDSRFGKRQEIGSPMVPLWEKEAELLKIAKIASRKTRNFWREVDQVGAIRYKPSVKSMQGVEKLIAGREVFIISSKLNYENFRMAGFFRETKLNIVEVCVVPDARLKYHNVDANFRHPKEKWTQKDTFLKAQTDRSVIHDNFSLAFHEENDTLWRNAHVLDTEVRMRPDRELDVLEANKLWDAASLHEVRDETYWGGLCYACGGETRRNAFGDQYCPRVAWKFVDGEFEYQPNHCRQYDAADDEWRPRKAEIMSYARRLPLEFTVAIWRGVLESRRRPAPFCPVCCEDSPNGETHEKCFVDRKNELIALAKSERKLMREILFPNPNIKLQAARPKGKTLRTHSVA